MVLPYITLCKFGHRLPSHLKLVNAISEFVIGLNTLETSITTSPLPILIFPVQMVLFFIVVFLPKILNLNQSFGKCNSEYIMLTKKEHSYQFLNIKELVG